MSVDERDDALALIRHTHTDSRRTAVRSWLQVAACALIHHASVALVRRLRSQNVGTRAVAWVCQAAERELLQLSLVYLAAFALIERTLVPCQSEPFEVAHYQVGILHVRALRVYILYAQHPVAALRLYRKPRQQRAEHIAQVHTSGWRRSEASFLLVFCIVHIIGVEMLRC